ncbi:MAG: hypothetical protein BWZ02_03304 [Lentisphaerae bacterium ADurb.BinA184]|nr:MAG: hypothetical protein BWZ02_03304 [Lentisphaerae bacterium ADurb.BinA184]
MSKPIPPGEITPLSGSMAAMPPIGKPYPQCPSAMHTAALSMPGRAATWVICSKTPASIASSSLRVAYKRAGTRIPDWLAAGISQTASETWRIAFGGGMVTASGLQCQAV